MADVNDVVKWGVLTGDLRAVRGDSIDPGMVPDEDKLNGTAKATPVGVDGAGKITPIREVWFPTAKLNYWLEDVEIEIINGVFYPPTGGMSELPEDPGVGMVASDQPDGNPVSFAWHVNVDIPGFDFRDRLIEIPVDGTIDFSAGALTNPLPGVITVVSEATRIAAEDAAETAVLAAGVASQAAEIATAPTDEQVASLVPLDSGSQTAAALSGSFLTYSAAKVDGTDQTDVLQAEINALYARGGGELVLPRSAFGTAAGVKVKNITIPNDGGTPPRQPAVVLRGSGAHWSGRGTAPTGGSTIIFTEATDYGLIKSNGLGILRLEDLTLRNTDPTINTPFVYTTNTTVHVSHCSFVGAKVGAACDQDALVLGGTQQVEGGSGWNDGFQGYGTVIRENFFHGIRTAVLGRAFANAVVIRDNTVWTTCGNPNGAPIMWNGRPAGGTQWAAGVVIEGNLLELPNYKYGVHLQWATGFTVTANGMFDSVSGTTVASIYVDEGSEQNTIHEGYTPGGLPVLENHSPTTYFYPRTQGEIAQLPAAHFPDHEYPTTIDRVRLGAGAWGPAVVKVQGNIPDGTPLLQVERSSIHPTLADVPVWDVRQNGYVEIRGAQAGVTQHFNEAGELLSAWLSGGRTWQTNGYTSIDTGPGGSNFDLKSYRFRWVDHTGARRLAFCIDEPTNASLDTGEAGFWFDAAAGALRVKGKKNDGTTVSGTIAMS